MENAEYKVILTAADVQEFQNISNGLHDGYITRVSYVNTGISSLVQGHAFDMAGKNLLLHILVTSLPGKPTFDTIS